MCDLCDPKTKKAEQDRLMQMSKRFDCVSSFYENLALGIIEPHTNDVKKEMLNINYVIKELVAEWLSHYNGEFLRRDPL